jgi:hypothetical protein
MRPLFSAAHLVFLVDENACGQEDEFDSHNQGQERKRIWIERLQPSDPLGIQDNPGDNEEDLSNNETKASEEAGNATTPPLSPRLLSEQLLLKMCYRLDVPFGCRGDGGGAMTRRSFPMGGFNEYLRKWPLRFLPRFSCHTAFRVVAVHEVDGSYRWA